MNRLKLMRAYLVGPMDYDRHTGKEWREEIGEWLHLEKNAIVIDPYHKPMSSVSTEFALEDDENYRIVKQAIADGNYARAESRMKKVRATDLRIVDHSDFQIINLDLDKRPCGTYEEMFTGNRQKKPLITVCPQGKKAIPPWLFGTFPHQMMFETWDEVKDYLNHIDTAVDEKIDTLGRWVFFDLEKQIRSILDCKDEK